jgi:RNA polymerase sigma-70 factor (ECF subfamily)
MDEAPLEDDALPYATALQRRTPQKREGLAMSSPAGDADLEALLPRLKAGDDGAFEALVRATAPRLLRVARRYLPGDDAAQDALQEAYLSAFRSLPTFEGRSALTTWLHRITVNAALQALRRRKPGEEVSVDELLPTFDTEGFLQGPTTTTALDAETLLADRQVQDEVRAAIDRLPGAYRTVLLLRDIEGLSIKETAAMLEISEANTKIRLHRARSALKRLLAPLLAEGALG